MPRKCILRCKKLGKFQYLWIILHLLVQTRALLSRRFPSYEFFYHYYLVSFNDFESSYSMIAPAHVPQPYHSTAPAHYVAQRPQGCRIGLMPERNIVILLKINQTRPCATFCYPGNLWQGPKVQGWTEYKMLYTDFQPTPLQPKRIIIETSNLAWRVTMGIVSNSPGRFSISAPWAEIWGWGVVPLWGNDVKKIFFNLVFSLPLVGSSSATT